MTAVIPFLFEASTIRGIVGDAGEPWFVGKDVCGALAIGDHHQALRRLPADERGGYDIPTRRGVQVMTCVNEPGLWRLIITSRIPAAERFKRWLVHEVLPAIRRNGRYGGTEGETAVPVLCDVSEETARLWLGLVREARLLAGRAAARALWEHSPLPPLLVDGGDGRWGDRIADETTVTGFIRDCMEQDPRARIAAADLHAAYAMWCGRSGEQPVTRNRFGRILGVLGHPRETRGIVYYRGLRPIG